MSSPTPRRGSQLTVQGWQNLVLSVMGVLVLAGGVGVAVLLNRTDQMSRELIDQVQPARVAAYQLQAALRDQETAVRGYILTADRQFLVPYDDGRRAEQAAADDIRDLVGGRPEQMTDLDRIERAAADWRTGYAEPVIAGVTRGTPELANTDLVQRGKAEFDRMRTLFDAQNDHLASMRTGSIHQLGTMQAWRDRLLIALVGAFLVTVVLLAVVARSAVTRPLGALAAACRRITDGNFTERITPRGPKDIRGIANDVENMRQRIVEELDSSRQAQHALDEQAVELRRSNAELEQFAYVASHDLQEPLRKVASFCQLLERRYGDKLDERGAEYIRFAVDGAKRMQVLINDLLTFSRVGRLNALRTEVDLDAALDAALGNLTTALEESGAQLVRPPGLPTVVGDPTLLAMVWQNLIGNAVKFRRDGVPPRIVVDCQERDDDFLLTVSDNGIGIAEEFVDKVFVIFQRLHGRDAYAGTGIGLALCKKIVEHHGGTIWIDTSYTEGTRFCFTIPPASAVAGETPATTLEGTTH